MKCRNDACKFIHIKIKSGRTIAALGLGGEELRTIPKELLSYAGGNLYGLDDSELVSPDRGERQDF